MLQEFFKRINSRALAMLVGATLAMGGISFIAMGIKDEGSIDIKSPFISGQIQSGFVGIILVIIGAVIVISCLFFKQKQIIEATIGGKTFKYTGYISERRMQLIEQLMLNLADKEVQYGTPQIQNRQESETEHSEKQRKNSST